MNLKGKILKKIYGEKLFLQYNWGQIAFHNIKELQEFYGESQGRREGGRAGNFYRGPRLNGAPEELDFGARNNQSMKEPYNFYRGPSILSTALERAFSSNWNFIFRMN
jgi:hypothetical protein